MRALVQVIARPGERVQPGSSEREQQRDDRRADPEQGVTAAASRIAGGPEDGCGPDGDEEPETGRFHREEHELHEGTNVPIGVPVTQ